MSEKIFTVSAQAGLSVTSNINFLISALVAGLRFLLQPRCPCVVFVSFISCVKGLQTSRGGLLRNCEAMSREVFSVPSIVVFQ